MFMIKRKIISLLILNLKKYFDIFDKLIFTKNNKNYTTRL